MQTLGGKEIAVRITEDEYGLLRRALSNFQEFHTSSLHPTRTSSLFIVLKSVLRRWLLNLGPGTTTALMEEAGCSYPTVAKALGRLERFLKRHSDRRVELVRFPRDFWEELVLRASSLRQSTYYVDQSGKPRTPDSLLRRLQKIQPEGIAVGGVFGARYWDPELDLHGVPRLDLCWHISSLQQDITQLVHQLDPALRETKETMEPVSVAVHALHRNVSFFEFEDASGVPWADPVECLLDLQELHLGNQSQEFIERIRKRRES